MIPIFHEQRDQHQQRLRFHPPGSTPGQGEGSGSRLRLANDGDADRLLAVDENGDVLDGDQIMLICALDLMKAGKLKDNVLVTTVMSNVGLAKAMKEHGAPR